MIASGLKVDLLGLISLAIAFIFTLIVKFLNLREEYSKPSIYCQDGKFCKEIIKRCRNLNEIYYPPMIWGRSGHVQTIFHAALGRFDKQKELESDFHTLKAADGATISYNVFSPRNLPEAKQENADNIVLIVPGIANHSKTKYINAITAVLVENNFQVAVFNHLGALPKSTLTAPRIFTYGCTSDLHLMIQDLMQRYKDKKIIGIGFSMGGNLLLKYLGEQPKRQKQFLCAFSICQGYDLTRASSLMLEWKGLRRFYNWGLSRNMKRLLLSQHRDIFSQFEGSKSHVSLDWRRISSASSLQELDEAASRRFGKFQSVEEFYTSSSSSNYMHKIELPILLLNAADDPLIPEDLFTSPIKLTERNQSAIFVVTKHGGHLGFFQGGSVFPHKETWLDSAVLEYILAFKEVLSQGCDDR